MKCGVHTKEKPSEARVRNNLKISKKKTIFNEHPVDGWIDR